MATSARQNGSRFLIGAPSHPGEETISASSARMSSGWKPFTGGKLVVHWSRNPPIDGQFRCRTPGVADIHLDGRGLPWSSALSPGEIMTKGSLLMSIQQKYPDP